MTQTVSQTAAPPLEGLQELLLEDVIPTPDNNRRIDPDSPDLVDLAKSIEAMGVIQPVVVRPHPTQPGKWDLRAGSRRYYGSLKAGRLTIPAVVRQLTDEQAMEVTVIENMQRQDLSPLEEATGVQKLLDIGHSVEEIAKAIGRTRQWVYTRARLTALAPEWREKIEADAREAKQPQDQDGYRKLPGLTATWGVAHLEEVAKLPAAAQQALLNRFYKTWFGRVVTVADLRHVIAELTRELGQAPFDLEDVTLGRGLPACSSCPDRAGAQPDLFGLQETMPLAKDTCLNAACFARKIQAHIRRRMKEEIARAPEILKLGRERPSWGGKHEYQAGGVIYAKCKKDEKGAQQAVALTAGNQVVRIYVKRLRKAQESGYRQTVGQARERLRQERHHLVGRLASDRILEEKTALTKVLKLDVNRALALLLALMSRQGRDGGFAKTLRSYRPMKEPALVKAAGAVVLANLGELARWQGNEADLEAVCQLLELDLKAFQAAAEQKHPEPAEWAGLKDSDPVPSKVKATKGKAKPAQGPDDDDPEPEDDEDATGREDEEED